MTPGTTQVLGCAHGGAAPTEADDAERNGADPVPSRAAEDVEGVAGLDGWCEG